MTTEHLTMDVDVEGLSRTHDDPDVTATEIVDAYNEWASANSIPKIRLRCAAWVVPAPARTGDSGGDGS